MAREVVSHRLVQRDMNRIRRYYSEEANPEVADRFYHRFLEFVELTLDNPNRSILTTAIYAGSTFRDFRTTFSIAKRLLASEFSFLDTTSAIHRSV